MALERGVARRILNDQIEAVKAVFGARNFDEFALANREGTREIYATTAGQSAMNDFTLRANALRRTSSFFGGGATTPFRSGMDTFRADVEAAELLRQGRDAFQQAYNTRVAEVDALDDAAFVERVGSGALPIGLRPTDSKLRSQYHAGFLLEIPNYDRNMSPREQFDFIRSTPVPVIEEAVKRTFEKNQARERSFGINDIIRGVALSGVVAGSLGAFKGLGAATNLTSKTGGITTAGGAGTGANIFQSAGLNTPFASIRSLASKLPSSLTKTVKFLNTADTALSFVLPPPPGLPVLPPASAPTPSATNAPAPTSQAPTPSPSPKPPRLGGARGRRSTMLTGPQGVGESPNVNRPTILG